MPAPHAARSGRRRRTPRENLALHEMLAGELPTQRGDGIVLPEMQAAHAVAESAD